MGNKNENDWIEGLLFLLIPIGVPLGLFVAGIYAIFFGGE